MFRRIRIIFLSFSTFVVTSVFAQNKAQSLEVVNRFYNGWKSLSSIKDYSTGNAHNLECNINECTQGGNDCESKSLVSVPREIDFLTGNSIKGSITIGPYINDFEKFVNDYNAVFTFTSPHEIATIKGADDAPAYRCYIVSKTYSWKGQSKQLTDTIWVKSNINRIAGIRNEYGGSRQVSSNNMSIPSELNSFSLTDLEIQASTLYDKGDYEGALNLYRQISLNDWTNVDANFYAFLMEGQNKGCNSLSKKYYQREAAWWLMKNYYNNSFKTGAMVYNIDKRITEFRKLGMPYLPNSHRSIFDAIFSDPEKDALQTSLIYTTMPPISCGLMVNCNSKNKYGFINDKGNIVIDYDYDIALGFNTNGLALVCKNGKYGYINKNGNIVIPLKYDASQAAFYNGKAFCIEQNVLKIIDTSGSIVKIINANKQYKLLPMYRTKQYAIVEYFNDTLKQKFWDVYDYDGNLFIEGCTECKTLINAGVIELRMKGEIAVVLDYKS